MTMTLGQVRDWHRELSSVRKKHPVFAAQAKKHTEMADAIDAHMVGMGEPVAHFIETSQGNWEQAADMFRGQPGVRPLYTAPPIDVAAVREVIAELRANVTPLDGYHSPKFHAWADKLEVAMPKESK
jgi:hypothetical protein